MWLKLILGVSPPVNLDFERIRTYGFRLMNLPLLKVERVTGIGYEPAAYSTPDLPFQLKRARVGNAPLVGIKSIG